MSRYQPNKGARDNSLIRTRMKLEMYNWCNFAGQLLQIYGAGIAYNDDEHKYESLTREDKHLNFGFV